MSDDLNILLGEIKSDIQWIKESLHDAEKKYAPFWIKYPVYGLSAGTMLWALNQLLLLIPNVKALL